MAYYFLIICLYASMNRIRNTRCNKLIISFFNLSKSTWVTQRELFEQNFPNSFHFSSIHLLFCFSLRKCRKIKRTSLVKLLKILNIIIQKKLVRINLNKNMNYLNVTSKLDLYSHLITKIKQTK